MLLTIGITLLVVAVFLIVLFYAMYHTYHGDLPALMKLVVTVVILIAAFLVATHFVLPYITALLA